MRTLYDSTTAGDIPKSAKMVAGYLDGRYVNVAALRKRFPNATVVTITVTGDTPGAHVCDTEPGNVGIPGAVAWAKREVKAGRHPTLYFMASVRSQVEAAVAKAGITGKVSYWIASYDNKPVLPAGAVAKQYADPNTHGKGHFDLSIVADYWPGVDPEPYTYGAVLHADLSELPAKLAAQLSTELDRLHITVEPDLNRKRVRRARRILRRVLKPRRKP